MSQNKHSVKPVALKGDIVPMITVTNNVEGLFLLLVVMASSVCIWELLKALVRLKTCRLHPGHEKARIAFAPDPECRCQTCIGHRFEARRVGRCSQSCGVCFDAIDRGINPPTAQ